MRISLRNFDHAAGSSSSQSANARKGFVIVEVIVAMILLAIAISSLAALLGSISQAQQVSTGNAYRNGVLMHEVNRLEGTPYDSLPVGTTSFSITSAPYPHTRVVTVTEPVTNVFKTINVVITPTNPNYKADSVAFTRTKATTSKVLCTICI
jgi:type II secretory pathway pseudopilin PulG